MNRYFIAAAAALVLGTASSGAQPPAPMPCTPAMGLNFICNLGRPEDFLLIPNTKYIITGGSAEHGWGLIDTENKSFRQLDLSQPKPDLKTYPDCAGMPEAKRLSAHGVAIRPTRTAGLFTYYTVTHGFPFESVQVFALDARGAQPGLQQPRLQLHFPRCGQVQRAALAAQAAMVRRMLRVAAHAGDLRAARLDDHAAADPAVGARGAGFAHVRRRPSPALGPTPPPRRCRRARGSPCRDRRRGGAARVPAGRARPRRPRPGR